jgi:hypothetical protein
MEVGRVLYRLAQAYAALLVAAGVGTALWLVGPRLVSTPTVAGAWFAVGGFGAVLLAWVAFVVLSRG